MAKACAPECNFDRFSNWLIGCFQLSVVCIKLHGAAINGCLMFCINIDQKLDVNKFKSNETLLNESVSSSRYGSGFYLRISFIILQRNPIIRILWLDYHTNRNSEMWTRRTMQPAWKSNIERTKPDNNNNKSKQQQKQLENVVENRN